MSETIEKCRVTRERINSGGYDSSGYYWGIGSPLYRIEDDATGDVHHYRADDRDDAKASHTRRFPGALYYR